MRRSNHATRHEAAWDVTPWLLAVAFAGAVLWTGCDALEEARTLEPSSVGQPGPTATTWAYSSIEAIDDRRIKTFDEARVEQGFV